MKKLIEHLSESLLFNTMCAIFQVYHGDIIFNENDVCFVCPTTI